MKFFRKATILLLLAALLCGTVPTALAAQDTYLEAGKTAYLSFRFSDVLTLDGTFSVSDPSGIVSGYSISVRDTAGMSVSVSGDRVWASPEGEPVAATVTVTVVVTLRSGARTGASCTVSFSGQKTVSADAPDQTEPVTQSATVTVKAPKVTDYTALNDAIASARELNETDFTTESWEAFASVLASAVDATGSTEQKEVDAATAALETAMQDLVRIDRTELEKALEAVEAFDSADGLAGAWLTLADAVRVGQALLTSNDQTAVDAAAAQINDALARVEQQLESLRATEPEEEPTEPVPETEPTTDPEPLPETADDADTPQCTVSSHRVWPILFFVSLALNAVLVVVVLLQKKKKITDNTPLVDYDIGDDLL